MLISCRVIFICWFFYTEKKFIKRYEPVCLPWLVLLLLAVYAIPSEAQSSGHCVDVPFDDCKGFHNKTSLMSSEQVTTDVISLRALYNGVNCSIFTHFFICAAVYPICVGGTVRYPCSDMCVQVRQECSTYALLLNKVSIFQCGIYPLTGRCITKEEARISIARKNSPLPSQETSTRNNACQRGDSVCFSGDAKDLATGWLTTWITVCFISTMLTTLILQV